MADQPLSVAQGRIDALNPPDARGWCNVSVNGIKYSTKFPDKIAGFMVGQEVAVHYATRSNTKDGRTYANHYLDHLEAVAGSVASPGAIAADGPIPPDVWEAKDRRIAMEAAYGSAARFYANRIDVPYTDLMALARLIYADVLTAGRGEDFVTTEELPF